MNPNHSDWFELNICTPLRHDGTLYLFTIGVKKKKVQEFSFLNTRHLTINHIKKQIFLGTSLLLTTSNLPFYYGVIDPPKSK